MSPLYKTPARPADTDSCPCGSGKTFGECCAPVLAGKRPAPSAEYMMRARFTAHVVGDQAFLHSSYLETSKKPFIDQPEAHPTKWTRLVIHSEEPSKLPNMAYVDFTAFYEESDTEFAHDEKAEFVKIGEDWIYTRAVRLGPAPFKSPQPKVGRNDPCPCGSGKKYKQCCLLKV
ncbi:MAG: YchJ family metal-binding protein [Opitutaceae bacterium]|jgi:SEC-C motif-containing protein